MAASVTTKGTRKSKASGLPPIEYLTLVLRCPLCDTEFTSEIPSVPEPESRDTDLRPHYATVDPLPALIHSCPSCHYTAYQEGYGVRREIEVEEEDLALSLRPGDRAPHRFAMPEDEDLEDLRRYVRHGDLVRGVAEGREPFGAERYVLGARIWEFLKEDEPYGAADYYLRGSWCARSAGDRDLEKRCQADVLQRFQHALDHSLVPEADRPRTVYLIGELSRRGGDFAKAVDLFSQLEASVDPDEEESVLFAHLARRQLTLAEVMSDINATIAEDEIELEKDEE
jgi:uncharacterized protein (DUF2225 family)